MKKKVLPLAIVLLIIVGTFIGIGANAWPSHMIEWEKTDHTYFCHAGAYNESISGVVTLTVTSTGADINPGEEFSVEIAITGFTEDEIGLDSSGNGNSTATLIFFAPTVIGTYSLVIHATEGGESFGTKKAIDWVEAIATIEVVESTDPPAPGIPGFDVFIIVSVGLLSVVPLILIIRRKRK
jgi:hypothetical protein